jgi:hypothetical protein
VLHHFAGQVLGRVARPTFGGAEGDHVHRIAELDRADDDLKSGVAFVGLAIGPTKPAKVVERDVDGANAAYRATT